MSASNLRTLALSALGLFALTSAVGCTTESYCFADCDGKTSGGGAANSSAGGDTSINFENGGGGGEVLLPDGGHRRCGTVEACNGIDDTCNGKIDEGIDFKDPLQCGTCENNCRVLLKNVEQDTITCTPPTDGDLGKVAGTCAATACADGYFDANKDPKDGCEYECRYNPTGAVIRDADNDGKCGIDDDCDGQIDEDLDTTGDPLNCGACGKSCGYPNAAADCVKGVCEQGKCSAGWWDPSANPSGANGCWYKCDLTNGGVEICDGLDNDCDNLIDNADDDLTEPTIGNPCQGGDKGECAAPNNGGVLKCASVGAASVIGVTCCDESSNDVVSTNPALSKTPTGLKNGECRGKTAPQVLRPGDQPEKCNGLDDDCNGTVDDQVIDVGQVCGSGIGICNFGIQQCVNGKPECLGGTAAAADDPCNGVDDNCDSVIDGVIPAGGPTVCTSNAGCSGGTLCMARASAADKVCATPDKVVGTDCNIPPAAPCVDAKGQEVACTTAGAKAVPQPCAPGKLACNGQLVCSGTTTSTQPKDKCGEDSNCDGRLDAQPDLSSSTANCGACGHDCFAAADHVNWTCVQGVCTVAATKCRSGFIDCDGNPADCEKACTPSGPELCNNFDDNCNCQVDENIATIPAPSQVCGVSGTASDPKCGAGNGTTGIRVTCGAGKWSCTFPPGYCNQGSPAACSTTPDVCDSIDNNCNGAIDEAYKLPVLQTGYLGQPCASDDGKAPPGDGACRGTGVFACNGAAATRCNAVRNAAAAGAELCDGVDNDCDGTVDEPFSSKGTNATFFVRPAVVQVAPTLWMYQYEASRPNATATGAGSGNGYTCTTGNCTGGVPAAPAGVTLDKTPACSAPGKIPWFNVTPAEVEETCQAMGGSVCSTANFTTACVDGAAACTYGYGAGCKNVANYSTGPFCNLGTFDFDGVAGAPNTDNLLPTHSARLNQCWANYGATPATTGLFDLTGNLREITKRGANDYPLMGGAFNSDAETGAACDFNFYSVTSTFKLFDTGFRCCFAANPSP